jgi:hypothetical protein
MGCTVSAPLTRKRGDTIAFALTIEHDGVGLDLTGYTLESHARLPSDTGDGAPLATADITVSDQALTPGRIVLDFGSSAAWPAPSVVLIDVSYTNAETRLTPTIMLQLERGITR